MRKILYFVKGAPTVAEQTEASGCGALLRNGAAWHERDCFEPCDSVMGRPENVPPPYRHLLACNEAGEKRKKGKPHANS